MKAKLVVPSLLARRGVEDALGHYLNEATARVASGFISALDRAYAHISQHPGTGSPRYAHELSLPDLRAWPLRGYPYLVFYVERLRQVDVWRVLHSQRDIPAWMQEPEVE